MIYRLEQPSVYLFNDVVSDAVYYVQNTSSEVLLPVFVTDTLTVTFWPALIDVGEIFRLEY